MYTFLDKKRIAEEIANADNIEQYRKKLKELQLPASGRIMNNSHELAVSLVYTLLEHCSKEEILALTPISETVAIATSTEKQSFIHSIKKKLNLKNTRR